MKQFLLSVALICSASPVFAEWKFVLDGQTYTIPGDRDRETALIAAKQMHAGKPGDAAPVSPVAVLPPPAPVTVPLPPTIRVPLVCTT